MTTHQEPEIITEHGQREHHTNYGAMSVETFTYEQGFYRDIEFGVGTRQYQLTEQDIEEMGPECWEHAGEWVEIPEFRLLVRIGDEVKIEHFDRYPNGEEKEGLENIAKRIDELLAQGGVAWGESLYTGEYHGHYSGIKIS